MLKVSLLEFMLVSIPESVLLILSTYLFSDTKINKKSIILSSLIFATSIFLVRRLPIHFGVHIIINMIIYIFISISINKIPVIKAISIILITTIIIPICEGLTISILKNVSNIDIQAISNQPLMKILCSLPSLLVFAFFVFCTYVYKMRKEERNNVNSKNIN